jgi:hypothetical protein
MPFGIDFADGTKIVGRIPRLNGTGVKGQHQPDLIIDEGQDYPPKGWTEVHETVLKDHVDRDGNPDFTYHFYGVHSGARHRLGERAKQGRGFKIVQVTAIQRPGWGKEEKSAAKAAYGGTTAPDYRRNILGEPGGAASPFFVTARLVACVDQDRESRYNSRGVPVGVPVPADPRRGVRRERLPIGEVLDLPSGLKASTAAWTSASTASPTSSRSSAKEKRRQRRSASGSSWSAASTSSGCASRTAPRGAVRDRARLRRARSRASAWTSPASASRCGRR